MELWDLYTYDRRPTGLLHRRGDPIPEGLCHIVVHVWLQNHRGQYLISQRGADRQEYPLLFECVAGAVLSGEDSLSAALRETVEEVGISLDPAKGTLLSATKRPGYPAIRDVWLFSYDGPIRLDTATTKEVAQAAWMTKDQIKALMDAGQMAPMYRYFFETPELYN